MSKQSYLVLNKKSGTHPVLIVNKDGRAVFLIPHEKFDIIGTTDIDYKGDPDLIAPTEFDKDYILSSINSILLSILNLDANSSIRLLLVSD